MRIDLRRTGELVSDGAGVGSELCIVDQGTEPSGFVWLDSI